MNKIYLLGHKARSGKDTLAHEMIVREGYYRFAFADKLKSLSKDLFNLTDEQVYGSLKESPDERYKLEDGSYLTPRIIVQKMGTEVGRNIYKNIWAEYVAYKISKFPSSKFVITDFRFPNEYDAIKQICGSTATVVTIRIDRPNRTAVNEHVSETALNDFKFDYVINNDKSVDDLFNNWKEIDNSFL